MLVTHTQGVRDCTLQSLQIFQPKSCKLLQILTFWAPSARHPEVFSCVGMKRRAVDRQEKEAKDFQSCTRSVWVTPQSLHLLAATLVPPGPSAGLCGGGCGDKRGTIPLGQAGSSLSQASWNRNEAVLKVWKRWAGNGFYLTYLRQACWAESKLPGPIFGSLSWPSSAIISSQES